MKGLLSRPIEHSSARGMVSRDNICKGDRKPRSMHQDLAFDLHACKRMKEGREGREYPVLPTLAALPGLTAVPLTGKETALSLSYRPKSKGPVAFSGQGSLTSSI